MKDIRIKQGASLQLALQFSNEDGSAFDVTTATIAAQVRDVSDVLVTSLPIVLGTSTGAATISGVDTSSWPLGALRCDIRIALGGAIVFTETFSILVEKSVTRS